jgi:hypothetical protein
MYFVFIGYSSITRAERQFKSVEDFDPQGKITAVRIDTGRAVSNCQKAVLDGKLLFNALGSDAALTPYLEIPVNVPKGLSMACASLTLEAQDTGPFVPTLVTAIGKKGNEFYFLKTEVSVPKIPACDKVWDESQKKSAEFFKRYQDSGLKDKKAFEDSIKADKNGFDAFRRCFAVNFPKARGFAGVVKIAQDSLEQLSRR